MKIFTIAAIAATASFLSLSAQAVTIDSFDDTANVDTDTTVGNTIPDQVFTNGGSFFGNGRELSISSVDNGSGNGTLDSRADINDPNAGILNIDASTANIVGVLTRYGQFNAGGGSPFISPLATSVDLTGPGGVNDRFEVDFSSVLGSFDITIEVTNGSGVLSRTETISGVVNGVLTFLFSDFAGPGDFTDASLVEVTYVSDSGQGLFSLVTSAPPPNTVVPLPASGVLLLAGIGGIAVLRRRT